MDFSPDKPYDDRSKENIMPGLDAPAVQRSKSRRVLGVLSENELQPGEQASQSSKHSLASDRSQLKAHSGSSSSSFDVCVEEAREVVLTASGQQLLASDHPDAKSIALENHDARLLLDLNSGSCLDDSALSDESLPLEEVLRVSEYAADTHQHMREREAWFRPRPGFLENHPEITGDMRSILVDWMVEVVREYKLRSETLHLSVNYVDRFLSQTTSVRRNRLQLVGTAALAIAAKYGEIYPPKLDDFVYTTDNTYTRTQLMHMELLVLKTLRYRMTAPTVNQFLLLFMSIRPACPLTHSLAMYMAELSLMGIDVILRYTPSVLAAAAYSLASYTVSKLLWPDNLYAFTGYTMADISPCVADLHQLYISAASHPHQAIREKYNSSRYCRVSSIPPPSFLPFT